MKRLSVDLYEVLKADDVGKVQYFIDGLEVLNLEELAATDEDRKKLLVLEVILEQVM